MTKAYRHLERLTELTRVMVKFGFGDLFNTLGFGDILIRARKLVGLAERPPGLTRPQRLTMALEEMGLVFVKLGQYLSTRQDITPADYLKEFARLQDAVPALPLEEVLNVIKGELDEDSLLEVSETPLAAASIGQVHSAKLPDGQEVVVKIRRPNLEKQAQTDLEILAELAVQVEKHLPFLAYIRPVDLVAEFKRSLLAELNYRREAFNHARFLRLCAKNSDIKIPWLHRSMCANNVLVMERIRGLKIDDLEGLEKAGFDRTQLARVASRAALEQIMRYGFFHADPHPGNIFVLPGPTLAFMDFGLVGQLDGKTKETLFKLAVGVARQNPLTVTQAILRLVSHSGEVDRDRLELEIGVFLDNYFSGTLGEIKMGSLLRDGLDLLYQHQLRTPPDLLLLVKAIVQYESLGSNLDPNFRVTEEAKPVLTRIYKKRFSPGWWQRLIKRRSLEAIGFLENLPRDLAPIYHSLKTGRFQMDMSVKDFDTLAQAVNKASYRLALAIVLGALLIGSALVVHSKIPPLWRDLPILGLVGFLGAAVIGFWLVLDFIRKDLGD
jgi:ubiquinone biosynthesis protein